MANMRARFEVSSMCISLYGQRTKWRRIIADNFYRNRLCTNVTDDRQTDGRTDGRRHIVGLF